MDVSSLVTELKKQRNQIDQQRRQVDRALRALSKVGGNGAVQISLQLGEFALPEALPPKKDVQAVQAVRVGRKRGPMSAAVKAKLSKALKRSWARRRAA